LDLSPAPPVHIDPESIEGRFLAFHTANPHVYAELRKMALQLISVGHPRLGIGMLWEVLRWRSMTTTGDPYKLNNDFRALYARELMDREPQFEGVFETRGEK